MHIWSPWKLSNFQDPPPPLSIYVHLRPPLTLEVFFQQTMEQQPHRACEQMKSKHKQNQARHIQIDQAFFLLNLAHKQCSGIIKDGFTVWHQSQ